MKIADAISLLNLEGLVNLSANGMINTPFESQQIKLSIQ